MNVSRISFSLIDELSLGVQQSTSDTATHLPGSSGATSGAAQRSRTRRSPWQDRLPSPLRGLPWRNRLAAPTADSAGRGQEVGGDHSAMDGYIPSMAMTASRSGDDAAGERVDAGGGVLERVRHGAVAAHSDRAGQLAAAFLLAHQGNTRAAYARDLGDFARWCADHELDPLLLQRVHVDAYAEELRRRGAAASTVRRRLAAVSGFFSYAVDEGAVTRNPAARVRRPATGDNVQSTGLTAAEAATLVRAAGSDGPRSEVVVLLLLLLGLRVSELCRSTIADLGQQRGHRVLTVTRKGGRRQAMVVPPRASAALDRYLAGRVEGPLVTTATGRPLDRHAVWRLVRRLATWAVPHLADRLHPHDLRHTCATLALDAGAPLRDVQDLLGHADPRTTRRYDQARHNLDRSPTHRLAVLLAEAGDS